MYSVLSVNGAAILEKTDVDVNLITITVPSPVAGHLPSKTATLQENAKTVVSNIGWRGRLSHDGTFIAGTEYTAIFKVVIKSEHKDVSYTLTDQSKITVNGEQSKVRKENNREAYVTHTFKTPIPE